MKQISLIILSILLGFCFSMKLFACDSRKTGMFIRGYNNTGHAGSYWYHKLNISCKNNIYNATLFCEGETPSELTLWNGIKSTQFKPYEHKTKVEITIINDNFSIVIPDQTRNICSISDNIKGIYRHFSDSDELLPDGSGFNLSCEVFTKGIR